MGVSHLAAPPSAAWMYGALVLWRNRCMRKQIPELFKLRSLVRGVAARESSDLLWSRATLQEMPGHLQTSSPSIARRGRSSA